MHNIDVWFMHTLYCIVGEISNPQINDDGTYVIISRSLFDPWENLISGYFLNEIAIGL